jgi:hypothetical protein
MILTKISEGKKSKNPKYSLEFLLFYFLCESVVETEKHLANFAKIFAFLAVKLFLNRQEREGFAKSAKKGFSVSTF